MSEHNQIGCGKFEASFEDYANGELPHPEAEKLTAHLAACRECRGTLEDARIAGRLIAVFQETGDPGAMFTRRVMSQIDSAERWMREQGSFWRPIEALSRRLAFSAALALALLFAYSFRTPSPAPAPAPAASAVFVPQTDAFATRISAPPSTGDEVLMAIAEKHNERY
ncbi:MAG: anti-sigma factor family protein [Candidatus Acidiferrales bacterium]